MSMMIQSGRFAPGAPPAATVQLAPVTALENDVSNAGRTATANSSTAVGGVKTIYGRKTGKLYFEAVLDQKTSGTANMAMIGVVRTDAAYDPVGRYGWCCGVFVATATTNGRIWSDAGLIVDLGSPATGNRYDFAFDLNAKLFWIRRQGGNWNASGTANPATGVGGIAMRDLGGYDVTPAVTSEVAGQIVTFNFQAAQFVGAVPSGFAEWPTDTTGDNSGLGNTTLNSLRNGNVTMSAGDLTATRSGASPAVARSPDPKSSGKFYVEYTAGVQNGAGDCCGFASPEASSADIVSGGSNGMFAYRSGALWSNGGSRGTFGSATVAGDRIDVAVDMDAKLVWFRRNGGNWNNSGTANPATGVGGIAFGYTAIAPCVGMGDGGAVGSGFTANLGDSAMIGAVPAGYTSGWLRKHTPVVVPAALRYLWTGAVA